MKKKILAVIMCFVMVMTVLPVYAFADDLTYGDFTYRVRESDKTATITLYTGSDENIVIPDHIGEYKVYSIGERAFCVDNRENIKSVYIPDTVEFIFTAAFSGCTNLSQVHFSRKLRGIGDAAFNSCTSLTNVEVNAEEIGERAFYRCSGIKTVRLNRAERIKPYAFCKCSALEDVYMNPYFIHYIETDAFMESGLKSISIGRGMKSKYWYINLGNGAFSNCKNLEYAYIRGVDKLDSVVFKGCTALKTVNIDILRGDIIESAFEKCDSLINVNIGTVYGFTHAIRWRAFSRCPSLKTFVVPNGTTMIQSGAFQSTLEAIFIPPSVTAIYGTLFEETELGNDTAVIYGYYGSYAETYANENNIEFRGFFGGDVDGDGVHTLNDVASVMELSTDYYFELSYSPEQAFVADANYDSVIDAFDVALMDREING